MRSDLAASIRVVWSASRWLTCATVVLSILVALIPAASLWVGKLLIDDVARAIAGAFATPEEAYRRLALLLAVQVGIGALSTLLATLQRAVNDLFGDTLQHAISADILRKAAGLEVSRFEDPHTYDLLRNAYSDVGQRPLSVLRQLIGIVQAFVTFASIGTLVGRLGVEIMPLVMLAAVPGVMVSARFGVEGFRVIRRRAPAARRQAYLGSILTSDVHVEEVRLFGFGDYLLEGWHRHYVAFRAQLVALLTRRTLWTMVASLLSAALVGGATLVVLRRAASGAITVGDFSLFALGIVQVQNQFGLLLGAISGLHESLLYMRNLFEFLELPARDLDAGEQWQGPIRSIEFQHVGFRYPLTDREVVSDVSFTVRTGEALALVGSNGAGKTTIVRLITRLFEPTSGRILVNGLDASRFAPRSIQREMSVIFQDFGQYQMTARENIGISHLPALNDDAAIDAATWRAGAAAVIGGLPAQLDTPLGRQFAGGQQLSGGQWQRLALARLYVRPASVRVFDEPTSSLDAAAEAEIIQQMRAEDGECITVLISHRLATVRTADRIVVLAGGRIIEAGTHDELIAADGVYATGFRLQARGYQAGEPAAVTSVS